MTSESIDLGRTQQRFGRDAAPVEADAAEMLAFDDGRPEAELRGANGGDVPPGPAPMMTTSYAFISILRSSALQPIETAFAAKLKALVRKAAERTAEGLLPAISILIPTFTSAECANYFAAAGHDAC